MFVASFLGALIATFAVSMIVFRILRKWDGGLRKVVFVHAVSLLFIALVGGEGMAPPRVTSFH